MPPAPMKSLYWSQGFWLLFFSAFVPRPQAAFSFGSCSRLKWRFQLYFQIRHRADGLGYIFFWLFQGLLTFLFRRQNWRTPCTHNTRKLGLT